MDKRTFEMLGQRFHHAEWRGSTNLPYGLLVQNCFARPHRRSGLTRRRMRRVTPAVTHALWYRGDPEAPDELLSVHCLEATSRDEAHDRVLNVLAQFESPLLERVTQDPVGDVSFRVPGARSEVFVRANLVVVVASIGPKAMDTISAARDLDDVLVELPPETAPEMLAGSVHAAGRRDDDGTPTLERHVEIPIFTATHRAVTAAEGAEGEPDEVRFFYRGGEARIDSGRVVYTPRDAGDVDLEVVTTDRSGEVRCKRMHCRVR